MADKIEITMADKIEIERELLKDAISWLTKMVVEEYHMKSVFPRHAEMTLARLNDVLARNQSRRVQGFECLGEDSVLTFQPSARQALAMAGDLETYRKGTR